MHRPPFPTYRSTLTSCSTYIRATISLNEDIRIVISWLYLQQKVLGWKSVLLFLLPGFCVQKTQTWFSWSLCWLDSLCRWGGLHRRSTQRRERVSKELLQWPHISKAAVKRCHHVVRLGTWWHLMYSAFCAQRPHVLWYGKQAIFVLMSKALKSGAAHYELVSNSPTLRFLDHIKNNTIYNLYIKY